MQAGMAGVLCVVGGLAAIASGLAMAATRMKRAQRVHQKSSSKMAAMPEGWGFWFFHGFSAMTLGTDVVRAVFRLAFWTVLGMGLIGVGFRLGW